MDSATSAPSGVAPRGIAKTNYAAYKVSCIHFRGLADPLTVRRAVLSQMRYVADVATSLPSKAYSTSGGCFGLCGGNAGGVH